MSARASDLRGRYRYNLFCRVLLLWVEPLLWMGWKRNLELSDLDVNPEELDAQTLFSTFDGYWHQELERKKKGKQTRLSLVIFRCVSWRLIAQGVITLFLTAVQVSQSIITGYLSQYFAEQNRTSKDTRNAYIYASCLLIMNVMMMIAQGLGILIGRKIGLIVRLSITAAIHNKILKLNQATLKQVSAGYVINLASSDVHRFDQAFVFFQYIWIGPLLMATITYLLYANMGPTSLIPAGIILAQLPIQVMLLKLYLKARSASASWRDKRIKIMSDVISGMRVIKMYGWEEAFKRIVKQIRSKESLSVLKAGLLQGSNLAIEQASVPVLMFGMFTVYLAMGGVLTAKTVLTVLLLLMLIQNTIVRYFVKAIFIAVEVSVTISRIKSFLELDEINSPDPTEQKDGEPENKVDDKFEEVKFMTTPKSVEVKNIYASWTESREENMTLQNINFSVNGDAPFLAVVGHVGSGKSTLLQCLLGELKPFRGRVHVKGKISYVAQDPWLFCGTIRENIVFGSPLYVDWYDTVLNACALSQDLEKLPNRDLTIIGERGVTLSGGQKARVSLARAVYSDSDVYLLDDPLSAVDSVVAKYIFESCIRGLLKDRVVLLVTHQLQFAEQANHIMVINEGKMVDYGNITYLRVNDFNPSKLLEIKKSKQLLNTSNTAENKTVTANNGDERSQGTIRFNTYMRYFMMGANPVILVLVFGVLAVGEASRAVSDWWIADWANCFSLVNSTLPAINGGGTCHFTFAQKLEIYAGIIMMNAILNICRVASMFVILIRASCALHNAILASILDFPIRFFDSNPIGRILNRLSKDVFTLDDLLPTVVIEFLLVTLRFTAILLTNTIANVWIVIPTCLFMATLLILRLYYMKTSREIKRLEAIACSPIYSKLSESLLGLSTIRSFGREKMVQGHFQECLNQHSKISYLYFVVLRWFSMRIDFLTTLLLATVAFSCIPLASTLDPGLVGLSLMYTTSLCTSFQYAMLLSTELENTMVSAERLLQYTQLETETSLDSHSDKNSPPPGWPQRGAIVFDKASFRYSVDTPVVLKPLSFTIQPGEKIGIIGRTGAGKSSLIQMLFRMAEHTGNITIDGINVKDVGLHDLRSSMSIIPQDPVLFCGSLRYNIDPFEEYNDSDLWSALEQAIEKLEGLLQFKVSEGGWNFSTGQRQLLCLVRAILRKNKIIVLDEATANVDCTTDAIIQKILRETFSQCTVLTVAHRLNTIIDSDRIMVMDGGEVVDFDDPYTLLQDENSQLKIMVDKTGPSSSKQLHQVAEAAYHSRKQRRDTFN
ncbi:hypothetical protein EMCRGX_G010341 [Ephydatia muelleri]